MSQRAKIVEMLERSPLQRTADLESAGISMRAMREAVDAGEIVRICPGIVSRPETSVEMYVDYVAIHMLTGGVIYGTTAAQLHEMTLSLDKNIHAIVPHDMTKSMPYYPMKMLRTRREEVMAEGVIDVETAFGMTFKATGPARTVIDLFDNPAQHQHAMDALSVFIDRRFDTTELHKLAETFGMAEEIRARLEMVTFYRDKGIVPK